MAEDARARGLPASAVRIGQPRTPLSDLYYRLMQGPWWQLVGIFFGFYALINVVFGLLYMLDEGGIAEAREGSFADAFFFSVQTVSTIGYGTFAPRSGFVHMLVTTEAMLGLMGFAVATGLVFSKFSRPRSRVMFSERVVVARRHKKPCLMLRLANARGNEVVEASVCVAVLLDEVSPEGMTMRRVHDLSLVRTTSPLFVLSWLIMHEIDENSPLHGFDHERLERENALIVVTMTGIDSTFAQIVHARHLYDAADVAWGRRYVDVISRTEDGRLQLDFGKFNETEPDPAAE